MGGAGLCSLVPDDRMCGNSRAAQGGSDWTLGKKIIYSEGVQTLKWVS